MYLRKENNKILNFIEIICLLSLNNTDPGALYNLGILFYSAKGFPRDYLCAKHYFVLFSKLNNSYALFMLGYMNYLGLGTAKDYSKAIKYFKLSAKLNNPDSLRFLQNHLNHIIQNHLSI